MCLRLLSYRITIAHKHRHPMKIKKYAQVITSKERKHYISNAKFKEERNGYHMELGFRLLQNIIEYDFRTSGNNRILSE